MINIRIKAWFLIALTTIFVVSFLGWVQKGRADRLKVENAEIKADLCKFLEEKSINYAKIDSLQKVAAKYETLSKASDGRVAAGSKEIARLKQKLASLSPNMSRDSAVGILVGVYEVPSDTLLSMGGNLPQQMATDAQERILLGRLVDVQDSVINSLSGVVIAKNGQISALKAIISLSASQEQKSASMINALNMQLSLAQKANEKAVRKIKWLRLQRNVLAGVGSGAIILLSL